MGEQIVGNKILVLCKTKMSRTLTIVFLKPADSCSILDKLTASKGI